jgi:hypothetical protein
VHCPKDARFERNNAEIIKRVNIFRFIPKDLYVKLTLKIPICLTRVILYKEAISKVGKVSFSLRLSQKSDIFIFFGAPTTKAGKHSCSDD